MTTKIQENALFLHFFVKKFAYIKKKQYFCTRFLIEGNRAEKNRTLSAFKKSSDLIRSIKKKNAEIAQLVEHDLAKVGVASSSLVFRSFFLRLAKGPLTGALETRDVNQRSVCSSKSVAQYVA